MGILGWVREKFSRQSGSPTPEDQRRARVAELQRAMDAYLGRIVALSIREAVLAAEAEKRKDRYTQEKLERIRGKIASLRDAVEVCRRKMGKAAPSAAEGDGR